MPPRRPCSTSTKIAAELDAHQQQWDAECRSEMAAMHQRVAHEAAEKDAQHTEERKRAAAAHQTRVLQLIAERTHAAEHTAKASGTHIARTPAITTPRISGPHSG